MRRVRTCCVCRKRFVTASGSQICPNCRPNHNISVNDDHDEKIQIESSNNYNDKDVMKHNDESKPPKKKTKVLKDTIIKTNPIIATTTMTIQKNENPRCIENKNTATHHEKDEKSNEKENDTFHNIIKSTVSEKRGDEDQVGIRNKHLHPKNQKVIDVELHSNDNNYDMHHQMDDNTPKKKSMDKVTTDIGIREDESDHLLLVDEKSTNQTTQQSSHENGEKFTTNPLLQYDTDLQNTKELKKIPKQQKQDDTICFICGKRFVGGLKSKVNHMKRCSKQQGISIKDLKQDCDDEDYFLSPDEKTNNHGGKKDWHNPEVSSSKLSSTQATLTNYFTNPKKKSIHQVLMAGAKRMAKTSSILLQKKQQNHNTIIPKRKKQWKRRRINNQSYTNSEYCPSHKRLEGTNVIVDGFRYANKTLSTQYILTHFHSDHYGGLSKSWNVGIIYCTLTTANLVHQKLGVEKQYLHPLPLHVPTVLDSNDGKAITVTLFDANHCPGAAIFLFQINNNKKKILHVGDFRWNREQMLKSFFQQYHPSTLIPIDTIYFDTTYCDAKYHDMPTQQEAIHATIQAIEQHLQKQDKQKKKILFLFGSYTIGKEKVYLAAARHFRMKVYVDSTRYKTLACCTGSWPELQSVLTTNKKDSCLWVVPNGHINFQHLGAYLGKANHATQALDSPYTNIVAFRPTGWSFSPSKQKKIDNSSNILNMKSNGNITVYGVPYSEHSSFKELVDCLFTLKPKQIIPTVSVSKSEHQIDLLLKAVEKRERIID